VLDNLKAVGITVILVIIIGIIIRVIYLVSFFVMLFLGIGLAAIVLLALYYDEISKDDKSKNL
jgi:uncharacterized metal-binding protein